MKFRCGAVAVMVALAPVAARAALVSEGIYALDTTTGLDWLNPNMTSGLSFITVLAGFGGWTSSGWQYATDAQWRALMTTYVGAQNDARRDRPTSGYYAASGEYTDSSLQVALTLGATYSFNDPRATWVVNQYPGLDQIGSEGYLAGTTAGIPGFGEVTAVLTDAYPYSGDGPYGRWWDDTGFNVSPGPYLGSFLVRADPNAVPETPSAVPEPSSLGLFIAGLAIIGMTLRARITKAAT